MHRCDLHVLEGVASSFDHGRSTATRQRLLTDRWRHAALSQPSFSLSPYLRRKQPKPCMVDSDNHASAALMFSPHFFLLREP